MPVQSPELLGVYSRVSLLPERKPINGGSANNEIVPIRVSVYRIRFHTYLYKI